MKEVLKNIFENKFQESYVKHLKFILSSFFYDRKSNNIEYEPKVDPDLCLQDVAMKALDTFISKDFTVSKIECDLACINEITYHNLSGNYHEDIIIYNIKEKDINIAFIDKEMVFCIGEEILSELINDNFSKICSGKDCFDSKDNKETYDNICNAKTLLIFSPDAKIWNQQNFSYKPSDCYNGFVNFQYILNILYGENIKTEGYQKIIEKYLLKTDSLIKTGLGELYLENKDRFLKVVIPVFLDKATYPFSEKEKQILFDYLYNHKEIDKVIRLILTFQYTIQVDKYTKNETYLGFSTSKDFLDYSFVAVEVFKLVEIVFHNLLNDFWNTKKVMDKYGLFDVSDDKINLGKMNQFFSSDDFEIRSHLEKRVKFNDPLNQKLSRWIQDTRNGFLHKHILPHSMLENSVSDSIDIICLLILTLIRYF